MKDAFCDLFNVLFVIVKLLPFIINHTTKLTICLVVATAKIIHNKRKYDYVVPFLYYFHWLRSRQWMCYKIPTLNFKYFLGRSTSDLSFIRVAHILGRRGLRSTARGSLVKSNRLTLDGSSIDVIGLQIWNKLPFPPPTMGFHSALKTLSIYLFIHPVEGLLLSHW